MRMAMKVQLKTIACPFSLTVASLSFFECQNGRALVKTDQKTTALQSAHCGNFEHKSNAQNWWKLVSLNN